MTIGILSPIPLFSEKEIETLGLYIKMIHTTLLSQPSTR
jgi:hypothetical protein